MTTKKAATAGLLVVLVLGSGTVVAVSPLASRAPRARAAVAVSPKVHRTMAGTPRSGTGTRRARATVTTASSLPGLVARVTRGTVTTASTAAGAVQDMTQAPLNFSGSGTVTQMKPDRQPVNRSTTT